MSPGRFSSSEALLTALTACSFRLRTGTLFPLQPAPLPTQPSPRGTHSEQVLRALLSLFSVEAAVPPSPQQSTLLQTGSSADEGEGPVRT